MQVCPCVHASISPEFVQTFRSDGPDKKLTFKRDLDLGPQRMFQMAHLHVIENKCVKLF